MNKLKALLKAGNHKLPKSTAIFNMGPAKTCPSNKLGLCQAVTKDGKNICYARRAEIRYPRALPYRQRQEKYWKKTSALQFVYDFTEINMNRRNKFTALRLNESGDFWTQDCIRKADAIASALSLFGVAVYCYTARKDLDFKQVRSLRVMGSNFKKKGIAGIFKMVEDLSERPKGFKVCAMNCRNCNNCLMGLDTVVLRH